ncbi:hypothetical protein Tco_0327848 [Tanacetum coccineum]
MHSIKNDNVLGVLKFVSKHEDSQVYGKMIPEVMVSKEIMETMAYKTYLAFATGKAILKKAKKRTKIITTPKKKSSLIADDNIILEDPNSTLELAKSISRIEAKEQEAARLVHEIHERLVTENPTERRRETGVVFRDTLKVSKKKPLDQSQKLIGVQVMSEEECLAAETKKAIKANKLATGPQKIGGSTQDDSEDSWGTESDDEVEDIPWVDTDDDEEDDDVKDDNDDDRIIDIKEKNDDEHTESDDEDQAMKDAEKHDEDKAEEEKGTEQEPLRDEQAKDDQVEVLTSKTHKEKPKLFVSTSSHSVSSNYDSSPECSLLVPPTPTTPTPPLIPTTTTTTTEAPTFTSAVPNSRSLSAVQLKVLKLEKEIKELKSVDHSTTLLASLKAEIPSIHTEELKKEFSEKRDYKDVIKESMQANVINEVKNHLPKFLPKVVTDFATSIIQSTVKETLENTPLFLAQTSSQAQSPYKAAESLSEFELKKILIDKIKQNIIKSYGAPTLMKRDWEDDDENEDPSAGPNQGKNTKKRRTKESEPLNKSSTSKDSSKVEEPVFEKDLNDVEQTIDDEAAVTDIPLN